MLLGALRRNPFMADEKPQNAPEEESKKDTVRINLPPGLTGRPTGSTSTPPPAPKPAPAPVAPEDESKKETAVMGMPVTTPKPKKDTSRVQVSAAKPAVPEMPRPTVRLKREEPGPVPMAPQPVAPRAVPAMAEVSSGSDVGMSVGAMILSLAVLAYLAVMAMG